MVATARERSLWSFSRWHRFLLLALVSAVACDSVDAPVVKVEHQLISDQTHNAGTSGFYWLPPILTSAAPFTAANFDGTAAATVKVDLINSDGMATNKATFTGSQITISTSTSSSFPGTPAPFYGATWSPGATALVGQTYRVHVDVLSNPTRVLGVADVKVVATQAEANALDRNNFVPLIASSTAVLKLTFRLEKKDTDADLVFDWKDNCPKTSNFNQLDSDSNGLGDACQCLNKPDGTTCATGCKTSETCQAGVCSGGSNKANGSACSTGNPCKQSQTCSSGTCGGGSNKSNGTSCSTGNPCKQSQTCSSGTCGGGSNKSNGTSCSTGNPCKQSQTCSSGTCGGGSNKSNGTACDDTNACTRTDACQSGSCIGSNPIVCTAQDQCHTPGTCTAATGICSNPVTPNGTSCDDGNGCTPTDVCQVGVCNGSSAPPRSPFVLYATTAMVVRGPSTISGGQLGVKDPGGPYEWGDFSLALPEGATVELSRDITAASVLLDGGASVGRVNTDRLVAFAGAGAAAPAGTAPRTGGAVPNGAGVFLTSGTGHFTSTGPFPSCMPSLPAARPVAPGLQDVSVAANTTVVLAPGAYRDITVLQGATLRLSTGLYQVGKILMSPAARLENTGPVDLRIADLLRTGSPVYIGPAPGLPLTAKDLSIQVGGFGAEIGDGDLRALVLAPTGSIELGAMHVLGALFGKVVYFVAASSIAYEDGFPGSTECGAGPSPGSCEDGDPCNGVATCNTSGGCQPGTAPTVDDGNPCTVDSCNPVLGVVHVNASDGTPCSDGDACTVNDSCQQGLCRHGSSGQCLTVNAGPDVTLISPNNTTVLRGSASLPPQAPPTTIAFQWSVVSGPAPVVFALPTSAVTGAQFDGEGTYILRLSATANGQSNSDEVVVNVNACPGETRALDVALVIDNSPSMDDEGKLAAAKVAAKQFVDNLDLSRDQVSLSVFSVVAATLSQLTNDGATTKALIDGITTFEATNIGAGVDVGRVELQSPRHRPASLPVLLFLTDGENTVGDPQPAIAALKATSIRAIAIGLGSSVDGPLLRQIASSVNDYYYATTGTDLKFIYDTITNSVCRNRAPLVRAGPDQGSLGVQLPLTLRLNGEVHDDGPVGDPRLSSRWSQVSGPDVARIFDLSSPTTEVLFFRPGTYVLRLTATDTLSTSSDDVSILVDDVPSLSDATLTAVANPAGTLTVGETVVVTATLRGSGGLPIQNFPVEFTVTGAHGHSGAGLTNANGQATLTYPGTAAGTDHIDAVARDSSTTRTAAVTVQWAPRTSGPGDPPPQVTGGWIASPVHQSVVTGVVPVILRNDITLASGSLDLWPLSEPSNVRVLAPSVSGGPGATLANLDTTVLANGTYVLRLTGTNSTGQSQISLVAVIVKGDYKPGRVVFSVTDFTVPVAGLPITIGRTYDSLERGRVGDFGFGWSLSIAHPRLETNPAGDVTITEPGSRGRRTTFRFTPTSFPFYSFLFGPSYTPEAGTFGKLTSDGCPLLVPSAGNVLCFLGPAPDYNPTEYTYTDPVGQEFKLSATGQIKSIKDLSGNILTFTAAGITSSAGDALVQVVRDAQGRITDIRDLGGPPFNFPRTYHYAYSAAGDLATFDNPSTRTYIYTYDTGHLLIKTSEPVVGAVTTTTYDAQGRLASVTDGMGHTTSYAYNVPARTTTVTAPDQGQTRLEEDANGDPVRLTDPLGRVTSYQYDANRLKTAETNPAGETTRFSYSSLGLETEHVDAGGRTWRQSYNDAGQLAQATDAAGRRLTVTYDSNFAPSSFVDDLGLLAQFTSSHNGLPVTIADANGAKVFLTYDARGFLTSRADRLGRLTKYQPDPMGRVVRMLDPRGKVTNFSYTGIGLFATEDDSANRFHTVEYDGTEYPILLTQAEAGSMRLTYDAAHHLISRRNFDNTTRTFTRDFRGNALTETDERGNVTQYQYDKAGQLTKTTHPDGTFTTTEYDLLGRPATVTDERGGVTRYEYEAGCGCADRVTKVTDRLGRITRNTYDAVGRRTATTDPAGRQTSYAYDIRGRLTTTTNPDGTTRTMSYDAVGRMISQTDEAGKITRYSYDAEGQLLSVTDALGSVTRYEYGPGGDLVRTTDANGHITVQAYDVVGRLTSRTLPLAMAETFTYDRRDNRLTRTDFRGKATSHAYDLMSRLLTITPDASLGEPATSFTYSPTGQRATMIDASGSTTYTYDNRDRLSAKATPAGTLSYTYDGTSNVTSIRSSNASGVDVTYAWDVAGQLTSVTDNRAPGGITVASYGLTGQPTSFTQPTGVQSTLSYDTLDRVTQLAYKRGTAPTPFASFAYALHPTGRRLSMTELSGRKATYSYDAAYRLTGESITGSPSANGAISYALDPVGNRLSRTSTVTPIPSVTSSYDLNDRLASDGYDLNGNTVTRDGATYAYDFADRLKSKNGTAVTMVYDGDGERVAKTAGGVTTRFLVDDLNPSGLSQVMEEVVGGVVQRVYTHGTMLVSESQRSGTNFTTSYYGYDAQGNVTFLTDAAGAVTDTYTYDAFGNLVARTGTTANEYLYGGQRFDGDMGLYHLRARWYEPGRGRFVTMDSFEGVLTQPFSLNKYAYGHADPVNLSDPTGLSSAEYGGTLGVAFGASAPRILLIGAAGVGKTVVAGTAASALGFASACVFATAMNGIQQLQAPVGTIVADPPWPFQFCLVRMRGTERTLPRVTPLPAPPGDCPPEEYEDIKRLVKLACKKFPRGCKENMSCAELILNWTTAQECVDARRRMMVRCFRGGDDAHRNELEQALLTGGKCAEIILRKGCAN